MEPQKKPTPTTMAGISTTKMAPIHQCVISVGPKTQIQPKKKPTLLQIMEMEQKHVTNVIALNARAPTPTTMACIPTIKMALIHQSAIIVLM